MRDALSAPVSAVVRASDAILEHATGAYLESSARVRLLAAQGLPDADVSVLLLNTVDDHWIRVLRQDAARAPGTPVPVVMIADRATRTSTGWSTPSSRRAPGAAGCPRTWWPT